MKNESRNVHRARRHLPALFAVSSSLAALPSAALELGDLTVQSKLGQPLRASISYALAPNEEISNNCISLRPGNLQSGVPGIGQATLSVADGVIRLVGDTAIREPVVAAYVRVNCPYTANVSREYTAFVDPALPAYETTTPLQRVSEHRQISPDVATQQPEPRVRPTATSTPAAGPVVRQDIGASTRHRVLPGESLSTIASRIKNRPVGLWPAIDAIFAANPDAFIDSDPNKLKAGSWLTIPSFDGNAPVIETSTPANAAIAAPIETATPETAAAAAVPTYEPTVTEPAVYEPVVSPATDGVTTDDLQPGDVVDIVIPDTQLEGPTTTSTSPNVPTAIVTPKSTPAVNTETGAAPSWLLWLAGGGIALIFALLLFGRRMRRQPLDAAPQDSLADTPMRRATDVETEQMESLGVDYDLTDESPTEENLALDADLLMGTGLGGSTEMDVAQDFGFAESTTLDVELPFEPMAEDQDDTAVLDAADSIEDSIILKEIHPDDDDYDMSVIMDATKMPRPEDVTEHDLKAVKVKTDEEESTEEGYTISQEVDYQILEQDYEDEMTATQALNAEIARAAAELTGTFANAVDAETAAMPLATVTEIDVTAQMPAQNDEIGDLDDTGINETITVRMSAEEETAEMPAATNDEETIEMHVESGKTG